MTHLLADLRLAARSLLRAPLFVAVAVASIALGVGASTAVFTLLDQVALRGLPVVRPSELVQLSSQDTESYGGGLGNGTELSWPMYRDLRDRATGFDGLFGRSWASLHVGHAGRTERVDGELVSGSYFTVLGLAPAAGRLMTADDDVKPSGHAVTVLAYDYWQRRFAGRTDVIGQAITVNGHPMTVIGVAPRGFFGLEMATPADVFLPLTMQPQVGPPWLKLETRRFRWVQVFGRLANGMTPASVAARLGPLYATILADEVRDAAFTSASAETRRAFLAGRLSVLPAPQGPAILRASLDRPLRLLMAVAFGVLLIACANVANLLIARGVSRQRELALRVALGAGRARLTWLLLAEAILVAVAGSVVGLVLASWGVSFLVATFTQSDVASPVRTTADARILAFTIAITALTAIVSGLVPALRALPSSLAPALKSAGGGVVREQPRLRRTLVAVQVGLSFLMLAASGLFVRTLDNLQRAPSGLAVDHVLSFQVSPDASAYSPARSVQFVDTLLLRLRALPGVNAAGIATVGILEGGGWSMDFTVEGFTPKPGESASSMANAITPGFFEVLKVPLRLGRAFDVHDRRPPATEAKDGPYRHAIVNDTFVTRYLGGRDPIGRHIGFGSNPGTEMPIEIVGVVPDTKYMGVRETPRAQIFLPAFESDGIGDAVFYVRTSGEPDAFTAAARREVAALDPGLAVFNIASLDQRVARSLRNERLLASLSTAFAALATLLAMVGVYGVMAYTVSKRSREIGIRIALGARASQVAGRIVREAGLLVATGLALSAPLVWWLGRYVRSQLYGIEPADPWTLLLAATGMIAVAALAAGIPARRAAHVDPMTALRDE
ncbi:MAG: ABC transporter permease [Vicinamibacteraceae bacterium]